MPVEHPQDVKLRELDVRAVESVKDYQRQQNRISDLTIKLQETDIVQQRLRQEMLEKQAAREGEIKETRRHIERLHLDLAEQAEVRSEFTGRVLDVSSRSARSSRRAHGSEPSRSTSSKAIHDRTSANIPQDAVAQGWFLGRVTRDGLSEQLAVFLNNRV